MGLAMGFANAAEDFEFSIQFVLGRVPNLKFKSVWRALGDTDQHVVARAICEYLERENWRFHRGPSKSNARPADTIDGDPFDEAIDDAIAACDDDPRATIKALLIANSYLEAEMRIAQNEGPVINGRMLRTREIKS